VSWPLVYQARELRLDPLGWPRRRCHGATSTQPAAHARQKPNAVKARPSYQTWAS